MLKFRREEKSRSLAACLTAFLVAASTMPSAAVELGMPAACSLGEDCFVQQFPDVNPASDVAQDPFCGSSTYEGHSGLDLRVLSMKDVERGVPVVAMADGKVLRTRDGEPDSLVRSKADRLAVENKECGNGLVVDHGDGIQVQYCHMKQESLIVRPGDTVQRGDKLGDVGASGAAQFPHVHVTIRRGGVEVDGITGKLLSDGCAADVSLKDSLFEPALAGKLGRGGPALLGAGLTGSPLNHQDLVVNGAPGTATDGSKATLAWAWFANLRGGDKIMLRLRKADGTVVFERTGPAIERNKASYSSFAGTKGAPAPGEYAVDIAVVREGRRVLEKSVPTTVK
jgi:murein DD-endopeptidase MepM/ murein hydrolase activator NlpD